MLPNVHTSCGFCFLLHYSDSSKIIIVAVENVTCALGCSPYFLSLAPLLFSIILNSPSLKDG